MSDPAAVSPAARPLIAGNWKMHGLQAQLGEAAAVAAALERRAVRARVALCPPATLLSRMAERVAGTALVVGAQDCGAQDCGPCTGEVSATMLADAGARLVLLGHSERRGVWRESDALVAAKTEAALRAGLEPVICLGETLEERRSGRALEVVEAQADHLTVQLQGRDFCLAYEPVWAIGSGLTPSLEEIAEVHAVLRARLRARFGDGGATAPILYGGSVKPTNAAAILALPDVGGALVGGASLRADDFLPIVDAAA